MIVIRSRPYGSLERKIASRRSPSCSALRQARPPVPARTPSRNCRDYFAGDSTPAAFDADGFVRRVGRRSSRLAKPNCTNTLFTGNLCPRGALSAELPGRLRRRAPAARPGCAIAAELLARHALDLRLWDVKPVQPRPVARQAHLWRGLLVVTVGGQPAPRSSTCVPRGSAPTLRPRAGGSTGAQRRRAVR